MSNELMVRPPPRNEITSTHDAMSVSDILAQKALIQDAMKAAMQDGQHFGKIPGCGDKPTLLQPGAQTILLLFRMNPDYDITITNLERGHREYQVKCNLTNTSGHFIGAGVGACSTMESKWRFRVAPKTLTSGPVPKEYWELRKTDPARAQELIGGKGFSTKKDDAGNWMIAEGSSDKVEHDNPADYYNTCLKMAKKRALVDATLTRTAASDIFTQDIEDLRDNMESHGTTQAEAPRAKPPTQQREQQPQSGQETRTTATFKEFRQVNSKPDAAKPWTAWFCTFEDSTGHKFEAGTFSKSIGEKLDVLQGAQVDLAYRPGKKAGSFEIVSIEPSDDVPN